MPKLVNGNELLVSREKQKTKTTNYELRTKNLLGFTLIELLVVIAIIAVLTTIGFINYNQTVRRGRDAKRQADLAVLQSVVEQYHSDNHFYPPAFTVSGQFDNSTGGISPAPTPVKIYLRALPVDPIPPTLYSYVPSGVGCSSASPSSCTGYCVYTTLEATTGNLNGCAVNGSFNYAVTRP